MGSVHDIKTGRIIRPDVPLNLEQRLVRAAKMTASLKGRDDLSCSLARIASGCRQIIEGGVVKYDPAQVSLANVFAGEIEACITKMERKGP